MPVSRLISPTTARRLAIACQRLNVHHDSMLDTIRALGCLQLDPISAVAKSHYIVLWSRLGQYDSAELERLLWEDRALFEYWAHAASIVLTENYPIHAYQMQNYTAVSAAYAKRWREWADQNEALMQHVLQELAQRGPLQLKEFEADELLGKARQKVGGWSGDYGLNRMVDYLWTRGNVLVSKRRSGTRLWDLAERILPTWTPHEVLDERENTRRASQIALKALGVATPKQIMIHFTRGNYKNLPTVLNELHHEGLLETVKIADEREEWVGKWYIHRETLPLLEALEAGEWQPRNTLLSPFDNLICDRNRTERFFDFQFTIEIYVPKAKRQYGYYVLPILLGDRLIGRIDPTMNRKEKIFTVNNVYAEAHAPRNAATGEAVAKMIADFAGFLGAEKVVYGENVPEAWRDALR